jgi:hypothetical protein
LGPALFSGNMGTYWIYIVGPLLGALVAALIFRLFDANWNMHPCLDECGKPIRDECCNIIYEVCEPCLDKCGKPMYDECGKPLTKRRRTLCPQEGYGQDLFCERPCPPTVVNKYKKVFVKKESAYPGPSAPSGPSCPPDQMPSRDSREGYQKINKKQVNIDAVVEIDRSRNIQIGPNLIQRPTMDEVEDMIDEATPMFNPPSQNIPVIQTTQPTTTIQAQSPAVPSLQVVQPVPTSSLQVVQAVPTSSLQTAPQMSSQTMAPPVLMPASAPRVVNATPARASLQSLASLQPTTPVVVTNA